MNVLILVVLAALAGIIPALIAGGKGRSAAVWWLYGAALFPVAFAHAWWLPDDPDVADAGDRKSAGRDQVLCAGCSEPIPAAATRCRYCGTENAGGAGSDGDRRSGEAGVEAWDDAFASLVKGGGRPGPRPEPEPQARSPAHETFRSVPTPWLGAAGAVAAVLMIGVAVSAVNDSSLSQLWTTLNGDKTAGEGEVALGEPAGDPAARPSGAPQVEPAPPAARPGTAPPAESSAPPPTVPETATRSGAAGSASPAEAGETPKPPPVAATRPPPVPKPRPAVPAENAPAAPRERAGSGDTQGVPPPAPRSNEDAEPERPSGSTGGSTAVATAPDKPAEEADRPADTTGDTAPQQARRQDPGSSPPSSGSSDSNTGDNVTAVGDLVYWIQRELSILGYFRGEVDGRAGESTREAIRAFQRAQKLTPTGEIDQTLITSLRRASAGREGRRRGLNDGQRSSGGAIATADSEDEVPRTDD